MEPKSSGVKDTTNIPINKIKPVTGTKEWAMHNKAFITGCEHDCLYCYSKAMAIRFKRNTIDNWKEEVIREKDFYNNSKKLDGKIFFPSSHDISPRNLEYSIIFLKKLLQSGNEVLVVTKPHLECIQRICSETTDYKNQILFRFTIGSIDSNILKFWEPGAPDFSERLSSLIYAFNNGFATSISSEPMLDNNIEELVEKIIPFVTDAIWIGKVNRLNSCLAMNAIENPIITKAAQNLIALSNDSRIKQIYAEYENNPKIKWKDSIKKVVGIPLQTQKGLDV